MFRSAAQLKAIHAGDANRPGMKPKTANIKSPLAARTQLPFQPTPEAPGLTSDKKKGLFKI